jgi:hypothetical protein
VQPVEASREGTEIAGDLGERRERCDGGQPACRAGELGRPLAQDARGALLHQLAR